MKVIKRIIEFYKTHGWTYGYYARDRFGGMISIDMPEFKKARYYSLDGVLKVLEDEYDFAELYTAKRSIEKSIEKVEKQNSTITIFNDEVGENNYLLQNHVIEFPPNRILNVLYKAE